MATFDLVSRTHRHQEWPGGVHGFATGASHSVLIATNGELPTWAAQAVWRARRWKSDVPSYNVTKSESRFRAPPANHMLANPDCRGRCWRRLGPAFSTFVLGHLTALHAGGGTTDTHHFSYTTPPTVVATRQPPPLNLCCCCRQSSLLNHSATMASRGVSILKFVGTVSLGLLTVRPEGPETHPSPRRPDASSCEFIIC